MYRITDQKNTIVYEHEKTGLRSDNHIISMKGVPVQIGEALQDILRKEGISPAEFARMTRKTPGRISQLLNGKKGSNMERLLRLLDTIGYEIAIVEAKRF